ncbi:MAG TPA: hypothetical protein VF532_11630 [Candidatus Angelobacter sp.]
MLAGIVAGIILTLGTDVVLHVIRVFPPVGQWTPSGPLVLATVYRAIYSVIAGYITARLAPNRPIAHALIGGAVAVVVSIAGAVATWNLGLGPHWYPVALVVLAMPTAWLGGWLRLRQVGQPGLTR